MSTRESINMPASTHSHDCLSTSEQSCCQLKTVAQKQFVNLKINARNITLKSLTNPSIILNYTTRLFLINVTFAVAWKIGAIMWQSPAQWLHDQLQLTQDGCLPGAANGYVWQDDNKSEEPGMISIQNISAKFPALLEEAVTFSFQVLCHSIT